MLNIWRHYRFLGALSTALIRLGRSDEALAITESAYDKAVLADPEIPLFLVGDA
jgi:hypothetical protein